MPCSCISRALPSSRARPSTLPATPRPGSVRRSDTGSGAMPAAASSHRLRQRMIGALLQPGGQRQGALARQIGRRHDLGQLRLADGQGAGLVERHDGGGARGFQRHRVADQDAVLRADAGADHDGGRRRKAEGAGARDHQDRDGMQDRRLPAMARDQPAGDGHHRDHQHHRHEHRADLVDQALDRRLRALRLRHHAHDAAQHRFRADRGHAHQQQPIAVDRAADHMVALLHIHRPAFAGQQRLIDRGAALRHHAIRRDAGARLHHQQVAERAGRRPARSASWPSRRTRASVGRRDSSASSAFRVRRLARASSHLPRRTSTMMTAADSK